MVLVLLAPAAQGVTENEVRVGRERRVITSIFSAEPEQWYHCYQDLKVMTPQSGTRISIWQRTYPFLYSSLHHPYYPQE